MASFYKWKQTIAFLLSFLLLLSIVPQEYIYADPIRESELYSKSCVLMDGESGRILYGKNADLPLANASTTKILTCIVALEYGDMDGTVTISENACGQPKVHLGMHKDQQFRIKDLLYGLMLESFNDCAVAIAEYISGSVEDFAVLMNTKAEEIGCKDSYFITPNGLDAKNDKGFHHTTAADLGRIMRYCAWESDKSAEFLEITQTANYSFCDSDGKNYQCTNHNAFLNMMNGVISGKTGFTGNAGYCYTAALELDGKKFCIALLACGWPNNKTYKWSDAKKLFQYGLDHYEKKNIISTSELDSVVVKNGFEPSASLEKWGTDIEFIPQAEIEKKEAWYLVSEEDQIRTDVELMPEMTLPVKRNTQIGKVRILINDQVMEEYALIAGKTVEPWTFVELFYSIMMKFLFL